jgi:hypothetical protein
MVVLDYGDRSTDMATENRGVMVYLNPELEQEVEQYCLENDIMRRHKDGAMLPALGTGILQYLKSNLLKSAPISKKQSKSLATKAGTGLSKVEVLDLIAESMNGKALTREDVLAIVTLEIDRVLGKERGGLSPQVSSDE